MQSCCSAPFQPSLEGRTLQPHWWLLPLIIIYIQLVLVLMTKACAHDDLLCVEQEIGQIFFNSGN